MSYTIAPKATENEVKTVGVPEGAPKQSAEPPVAPPIDDKKVSELAKAEKERRTRDREIKALRAELDALKAPKPRSEADIREELKAQLLKDPTSLGLSYEQLSQTYLQQPSPEEQRFQALQQQIEAERSERSKLEQSIKDSQTKAFDGAIKQISSQVAQLVATDDAYEGIRVGGAQEAVVQLIKDTYQEDGTVLDVEEAAAAIEEQIVEQARAFSKLKKLQAVEVAPQAAEGNPQTQSPAPQKPLTTLTNAMVQTSKPYLSKQERMARAVAAFNGQRLS